MATRAPLLALALVSILGCEQPVEPATAELTEPDEVAAPPVAEPVVEPPSGTIEVPVPEGAGEGLAQAGQALGDAIRAGAAAEGDTPCEQAYAAATAMIQALQERTGQEGVGTIPPRDAYVSACNELPPAAQQCQVLGYALEHADECQPWRTDPRVLALRERLAPDPNR
ncbi:MAG: hypothetical protein JJ863_33965 [Deltaproteobacteria bacterium]|nr:hypothetical protein [Deltaproteobacteria bacterium]